MTCIRFSFLYSFKSCILNYLDICKKQDFCCKAKCSRSNFLWETAAERRGGGGDSIQRSGPANRHPMLNYKRADKVLFAPRDTLPIVSVRVQMPLQQQSFLAVSVNLVKLLFLAFSIVHYHWPLLQDAARVFPNKQIRAFYRDRPGSRARLPFSVSR